YSEAQTMRSGDPVLVDSRVCPAPDVVLIEDGDDINTDLSEGCYLIEVEGPVRSDGACWRVEGTGEVLITFVPDPGCPVPWIAEVAREDRFRLAAVEPEVLRARLEWW